jgi:hypothetical protein
MRQMMDSEEVTALTRKDEAIELAAARGVTVLQRHRRDLSKAINMVSVLMTQLEDAALNRQAISEAIKGDDQPEGQRRRMLKAVSIPSHAATIRDLSTAMKNLVALERQAFNLDDGSDGEELAITINKRGKTVFDLTTEELMEIAKGGVVYRDSE